MPIAVAEIKKMPVKEKLRLIEKLSNSIDADLIKTEEDALLQQRIELLEKGKLRFDTWENSKKRLLKKSTLRSKKTA